MKTIHIHRVFWGAAFFVFAGTAFGQGTMNRPGQNRTTQGNNANNQRSQMRESQIRSTLSMSGYTDVDLQDQVVDLAKQQQAASQSLLPKINALRAALLSPPRNTNGNTNAFNRTNAFDRNTNNGANVAGLFADYRSAVAEMQEARADAIDQLDKSISFSTDATLEALLTMLGIIGDETGFVSNLAGQAQLPGAMKGNTGEAGGRGGANNGGMNGGPGGMNGTMNGGMTNGFGGMNGGGMMPPPPFNN